QRIEESSRAFERVHAAGGADHLRQVHGGEAGAGAEIDHLAAIANAGARPGIEGARAPDTVLKTEAINLVVMGPEDVVAFSHKRAPLGFDIIIPPAPVSPE